MRGNDSTAVAAVTELTTAPSRSAEDELQASFENFFRESYARIERFLWRQCADRSLVEDAMQEAFIVAQAKWNLVSQHEKPLFWVRKVAFHKLRHLQREQTGRAEKPLDDVRPERFSEPANGFEAQQTVLYLLRRLPPRQAAVLALAADGSTDQEIALELDLTVNSVRTYKASARQKFAELAAESGYHAGHRRRM